MPNILFFDGRVASPPTLEQKSGKPLCKFSLIRNEFTGTDEGGQARDDRKVSLQFTAWQSLAERIGKNVMEGDQLVIQARLENNKYTDNGGNERYGYNFVVLDFDFGAPGPKKRQQLASREN